MNLKDEYEKFTKEYTLSAKEYPFAFAAFEAGFKLGAALINVNPEDVGTDTEPWVCETCKLPNDGWRTRCVCCQTKKKFSRESYRK